MSAPGRPWSATIDLRASTPDEAGWLAAALAPEAAREVPRASATLRRAGADTVSIEIAAADAGAMRAALNTYLGWVELALATVRAAAAAGRERASPPS
jgi:tRNA threonylcarbamoyladenosine modification (KEOPS) complex  Pcc1 subunit